MPEPKGMGLTKTPPIRRATMPHAFRTAEVQTPTGGGERVLPEKQSGWRYHYIEGWRLVDHPLGVNADLRPLEQSLMANGFNVSPTIVQKASVDGSMRIQVHAHRLTAEYLVIVVPNGVEEYIAVQGFPSLLHLLALLKTAGFSG